MRKVGISRKSLYKNIGFFLSYKNTQKTYVYTRLGENLVWLDRMWVVSGRADILR